MKRIYKNIRISTIHNKFRSRTTKSYVTSKRWYPAKGRLFLKCRCTSIIYKRGRRYKFVTTDYSSFEYNNIGNHKKLALYVAMYRAQYSHVKKGGKSNPEIKVLDYVIKYPTFYDKKTKVSKYFLKHDKGVNIVLENKDYKIGGSNFVEDSRMLDGHYSKTREQIAEISEEFEGFSQGKEGGV
jgi:hypothetical protein